MAKDNESMCREEKDEDERSKNTHNILNPFFLSKMKIIYIYIYIYISLSHIHTSIVNGAPASYLRKSKYLKELCEKVHEEQ
jgi:hypothetical protein